jgi:Terminase large subunit, T4likevirus-type, N-terminal
VPKQPRAFALKQTDRVLLEESPDDFYAFCAYYFQDWVPFPYQEAFHLAPQRDKLLIAGIRTGKTAGVAAGFMHYGWRHPGRRLANASISADQANVVYHECLQFASRPRFQHWITDIQRHPYPKIVFANGTELWFRSVGYDASLWRGWEFDWINVDEAAYVAHEIAIHTLQGRLLGVGRHGLFTMTSTPKGKGWLFERWKKGDPAYVGAQPDKYLSMRARTRDNVKLSQEAIEDLERNYTARMLEQELGGVFLDSTDQVFPTEHVIGACSTVHPEVRDLNEGVKRWLLAHKMAGVYFGAGELSRYELDPQPNHHYVSSWDLGKRTSESGRGAMVGGVLDVTRLPWRLVAYRWESGAGYLAGMEWIKEWHAKYQLRGQARCDTVIDATGKGDVVNEILEEESRIAVEGVVYSGVSKPMLIHAAQLAFERQFLRMPFIKRLVDQFQGYELDDKLLPQDIVMMLAQACHHARVITGDGLTGSQKKAVIGGMRAPQAQLARYEERRRASRGLGAGAAVDGEYLTADGVWVPAQQRGLLRGRRRPA